MPEIFRRVGQIASPIGEIYSHGAGCRFDREIGGLAVGWERAGCCSQRQYPSVFASGEISRFRLGMQGPGRDENGRAGCCRHDRHGLGHEPVASLPGFVPQPRGFRRAVSLRSCHLVSRPLAFDALSPGRRKRAARRSAHRRVAARFEGEVANLRSGPVDGPDRQLSSARATA